MALEQFLEVFIREYGLISMFLLVALEYANFPLPSEVVLPLIGMVGASYDMDFVTILITTTIAGIVGSLLNYWLGAKFGDGLLDYIRKKFPKTKKSLSASYNFIKKYNKSAIMLSRFVPVARTAISLVAGTVKMNVWYFILYSSIGILFWNLVLIGGGYFIGNKVLASGGIINTIVMVTTVLVVGIVIILFIKNIKKSKCKSKN
ncbi:DedA family protein [Romboutsia hominis]|uniref:DedA family protein n=1 Tax=Romboutsia hominis TaxID=1507512 RepID=UPI000B80EFAA|nr:DedA family protein [Romboutsia hominis]